MISPRFWLFIFLTLALARPWTASAQIYADVTLSGTVSGTFTISLEYQKAPATVANFIGLATGKKTWLDPITGNLRNDPFYNGLTFHRVIAGFVSQTGSRKGDGTDGPGYTFRNEIDPTLTHATPYTLAMANSGKDTNGSQWYITANTSQSFLDGNYTIFGVVTSGTAVCYNLNHVSTTPADRPDSPETITSIVIYGPSYASFNLAPAALPKVLSARPVLKMSGTTYSLGYDHQPFSSYLGFHSPDIRNWSSFANDYFSSTVPSGDKDVTAISTGGKHFFRYDRVDYSLCANQFVPGNLAGKTLQFSPLGGTLIFNSTGTAAVWVFSDNSFLQVSSYSYSTKPYSGYLYVQLSSGDQLSFDRLEYSSATAGSYTGRTNVPGLANISGTFTSSP